jgi:hypothetical protein
MYEELPGGDILEKGLRDLRAGTISPEALLVLIGEPRLIVHGIKIPHIPLPKAEYIEHVLYDHLESIYPSQSEAYQQYNALMRKLASLEHALDAVKPGRNAF